MPRGVLLRKRAPIEDTGVQNVIKAETVELGPMSSGYSLQLTSIKPLLFKRISAEIFFGIVLTTLIVSAFVLMYRNILRHQRLVEEKNDFINNVTHELKTPVATVSVALEAIRNFNPQQNSSLTTEYIQIAQRELERLNEITDRILKTSALENQLILISDEPADVAELIGTVLKDKKLIIEQRKATINFEKSGSDFSLCVDAYAIYQMVENLVDNALKYSREFPMINLMLNSSEKQMTLSVEDNGMGIPKEYQEKVFEKFFRMPTGDIHNIKGYGLGLSYVGNLVKALGGSIQVESEVERGTKFTISVPRVKPKKLAAKRIES
jgi:signal transduction histidine kinase